MVAPPYGDPLRVHAFELLRLITAPRCASDWRSLERLRLIKHETHVDTDAAEPNDLEQQLAVCHLTHRANSESSGD